MRDREAPLPSLSAPEKVNSSHDPNTAPGSVRDDAPPHVFRKQECSGPAAPRNEPKSRLDRRRRHPPWRNRHGESRPPPPSPPPLPHCRCPGFTPATLAPPPLP